MQLTLIKNPDESLRPIYEIARVVYAQTNASSLAMVEALASMIANNARKTNRSVIDVARDAEIFDALNDSSALNQRLVVPTNNRGFQMCLRVVSRMMRGNLPDCCRGATRFHVSTQMPDWALARGYIADVDGLLFYL